MKKSPSTSMKIAIAIITWLAYFTACFVGIALDNYNLGFFLLLVFIMAHNGLRFFDQPHKNQ